jgi:acetyltransferase-like isoleucine patch superfamily enzyme
MRNWLNKIISKSKGSEYRLDPRIPISYLFRLVTSKGMSLIRGKLSGIKNNGRLFFAYGSTVKCRSRFSVGHTATIARGVYIDALSTAGITWGNNVSAGCNTRIIGTGYLPQLGKGMVVGNNVGLGQNCFYGCGAGISIGDDTIIGDFVSFHAENHLFDEDKLIRLQGVSREGIHIGKNCWIGAKATILDGVTLGDGSIIAAGAVMTRGNYPANGIYGGVPARLIGERINKQELTTT